MKKIPLKLWAPYAVIAIVGFSLYAKTLFFGFTYLDDNVLILDNHHFLSRLSNLFEAFRHEVFYIFHNSAVYYRPILTVSFILDTQFGGEGLFFYHLTNIVIHLVTSCLVFVVLARLGYEKRLAFFFSLIFTVHPVLTQAVAWIPGRNDLLIALFGLTSFLFFMDFLRTKKGFFLAAHIFFFALALFTKETAFVLILMCILYALWVEPQTGFPVSKKSMLAAGWLMVVLCWFFLRSMAFTHPLPVTFLDVAKSVGMNWPALIQFVGKIVFPFDLSVLPIIRDTGFGYGIAAILLVAAGLLLSKQSRRSLVIFGAAWFLFFLLPSFIQPNPGTAANFIEHRVYLPMLGFFMVVLEIDWIKRIDLKKRTPVIFAVLFIAFLAAIASIHSGNFKDRISFWTHAAIHSPHLPLAHRNLGAMYHLDGFLDKAEPEYRKALELNPQEPMAHNNLGLVYTRRGAFKEAEEEFLKELQVNPGYADAYYNMGLLYYRMGELVKSGDLCRQALAINPEHPDARQCLETVERETHRNDKKDRNFAGGRGAN